MNVIIEGIIEGRTDRYAIDLTIMPDLKWLTISLNAMDNSGNMYEYDISESMSHTQTLYLNHLKTNSNICQNFIFHQKKGRYSTRSLVVYIYSTDINQVYVKVFPLEFVVKEEASDVWWMLEQDEKPFLNSLDLAIFSRMDSRDPEISGFRFWHKPYKDYSKELKENNETTKTI